MLVLCSLLVSIPEIRIAKAESTIYIRANGSIGGTDKIQRDGNAYIFTSDIHDSIVVERDNIVIDGAGYTLQGIGNGSGIRLSDRSDVTIKNTEIKEFGGGINLWNCSNTTIYGNTITANRRGIYCWDVSNNTISGNNITANEDGILIVGSWNNITENTITANNGRGIDFCRDYNNIVGNYIANNGDGIYVNQNVPLFGSHNNSIHHNTFINNTKQVNDIHWETPFSAISINIWDNGVEGNYWSDYEERYPNATEIDGTGIWDTPYVIDNNNQDNYPLVEVCIRERVEFEPYVSTFYLLFKDESHNLLGNLTGELRITETEKGIIDSVCKLSLSSPRPNEYHEPYIDKVELFTGWTYIIHRYGLIPISIPPPSTEKVTLHVDEDITLFEKSHNVSGFAEEPRLIYWFSSGTKISGSPWGSLILPTIRVYFSDGQKWEWEYEDNVTPPFKLWSGMDINLSELSGKVETETITLTTVEKVNPPIIDRLIYLYIVLASTIIVALAIAAVFVRHRKKKQT